MALGITEENDSMIKIGKSALKVFTVKASLYNVNFIYPNFWWHLG